MIAPDDIRGLSLWQPWASLVALGVKRIETRSRSTSWRGLLAIHATRQVPDDVVALARAPGVFRDILREVGLADPAAWPMGQILAVTSIATVDPTEVVKVDLRVSARELALGNYRRGRYAWRLGAVARLRVPLRYRGRQSLFFLDPDAVDHIRQHTHKLPEVA